QAVITVINPQGVTDADYLVLAPGEENSEILQINSGGISGLNITFTTNLLLQHRKGERVIKVYGNQVQAWRAVNVDGTIPSDSSFSTLGSPVNLDVDQPFVQVTDPAGGNGYWYKFAYYNSTTGTGTDI